MTAETRARYETAFNRCINKILSKGEEGNSHLNPEAKAFIIEAVYDFGHDLTELMRASLPDVIDQAVAARETKERHGLRAEPRLPEEAP